MPADMLLMLICNYMILRLFIKEVSDAVLLICQSFDRTAVKFSDNGSGIDVVIKLLLLELFNKGGAV